MDTQNELKKVSEELIESLDIDLASIDDDDSDEDKRVKANAKVTYKHRKIEHKLKKYETTLKKLDNINRLNDGDSQFLFVGNCGLENNISETFLEETFGQYGKVIDVIMPKKKSYAFVIYEQKSSTQSAIENLQSKIITVNQTPICFYLFTVDKVPETAVNTFEYEEMAGTPEGLVYLPNYIDDSYARRLIEFLTHKSSCEQTDANSNFIDLKRRKVKHYGYEFRYGTNDCDETKPLTDEESRMPAMCDDLLDKMLNERLIDARPDQLTVNYYEPGHGIGAHVDNTTAFDDYIVSLSLMSAVIMEFRLKETKKFAKLLLEPNSLVVFKGQSRYKWTHAIPERKHDLILNDQKQFVVNKRQQRISLTFRKIKTKSNESNSDNNQKMPNEPELILPKNDHEASQFEKSHVHNVYNQIAEHFSHTRHSAWPGVANFINSMTPNSTMLDVGCGNGKYLGVRSDLLTFGCDYSEQLIKICAERNFNCFVSDCLKIPCRDESFDYIICIAVLHHLSTDERRQKAINEMNRILKNGGRALITVWAKEQKYKDKESYYISAKSGKKNKSKKSVDDHDNQPQQQQPGQHEPEQTTDSKSSSNVHKFGKEFEKKDVFVAWHYNSKVEKSKKKPTDDGSSTHDEPSSSAQTTGDEIAQPQGKDSSQVYLRFYHVFENNELESLFKNVPNTKIIDSFYEQGNWCVIFEKNLQTK